MITKGQKINDRYQIIKSIGEGGMANVYLAYDTILDRNVAIKVLRGDLAADDKFVRRFQREALSASSLNHPNIVEVYDVGEDNGQYYIVMEYIEGKHLKALIKKRGALTTSEVIDIMLQITDGLAAAHDSYIIHRDIKPQNIMILENGIVKITDFGIAMAINSTQLTQTNSVMGSVHYLPPEQAGGKGSSLKSDIYSMGILMYELLTGKLPYKGENAVEIALKHLKEALPSIREELPNLAQSVENVILKSTAKNPKNRYADAREMNEDLKTILDDSRINEPRYVYPYPEIEFDDTKILKAATEVETVNKDEELKEIAKQITGSDLKKQNKLLIVLAAIFTGLIVVVTALVFLLPMLANQKEIKVPDVSNLEISAAVSKLQDAGFKVSDDYKEVADETIEEGKVVRTNPAANTKKVKGASITLYVSVGSLTYVMEDFTGMNYLEAKGKLENLGIQVLVEKRDVDDASKATADAIIDQSITVGDKLKTKDIVTFYIANIEVKYPDFTNGSYKLADVQKFCDTHGIPLEIEYVENNDLADGTIIGQSRPKDFVIVAGITLKISVIQNVEGLDDADCVPGLC